MKIDIVIPVYNEEKSIGNVLKDISKIDIENVSTIIIDDGSDDNTVSVASGFQNTQIFSNKNNRGHGYSVKKGLKIALERKSDIIVTMDGDGQHFAKDISKLTKPIINNEADVVIGSRFHNSKNLIEMKYLNRIGNRFFTFVTNFLSGQNFKDTQCGFRALSRDSVLKLDLMNDFNLTQEIIIDFSFKGLVIAEVPIRVNKREFGVSKIVKNPFSYGIRALNIIFGTFIDHYPMRFFGFLGFFPLTIGFLSGIIMLVTDIENRNSEYLFWVNFEYTIVMLICGFFMILIALLAKVNSRNKRLLEEALYHLRRNNQVFSKEK